MEKETKEKKKNEKKKIVPFDKLDITTATEDDIIKSGLKHKTPKDVTCYFVMFLIVVLAILPVALRIIMPKKKTIEERDVTYITLTCYKTVSRDGYELSTKVIENYRADYIDKTTLEYSYYKTKKEAKDGYSFLEIEKLREINHKGIKETKDVGKATFEIDFGNYPELKNNASLEFYSHLYSQEATILSDDGYSCNTESETKREVVYIDTGKKVE